MALARGAQHLGPAHEEAPVLLGLDRILARRLVERRPAAAGVVLRLRAEELGAAAGAPVDARLEHVVVLAAERPLGSLLPEDVELLRRQVTPPLRLRLSHLCRHVRPFFRFLASVSQKAGSLRAARRESRLRRPSAPRAGAARPRAARRSDRGGPRSRTGRPPASPPSPRRAARPAGGAAPRARAPAPPPLRARSRASRRRRRRASPSSPSPSARSSAPRGRSGGSRSSAGGSRSPSAASRRRAR